MRVTKLASTDELSWFQRGEQELFLADALDHDSDAAMSVGFARYRAGEENAWVVTYDEALVITKGAFTVRSPHGSCSTRAGEVIYLPAGAEIVYQADADTELVYVTYPHWFAATRNSPHADKLAQFHPVAGIPG